MDVTVRTRALLSDASPRRKNIDSMCAIMATASIPLTMRRFSSRSGGCEATKKGAEWVWPSLCASSRCMVGGSGSILNLDRARHSGSLYQLGRRKDHQTYCKKPRIDKVNLL